MGRGERICALIPAAGMSRRMGAFKPLLPLGDRTVIERTVQSVLSGGAESAVVVTGRRAEEVEAVLERAFGSRVRFVRNPDYETTDMLRSLQLGAAALPACGAFFLLPGDMPGVGRETFGALLEARERTGAPVIFPAAAGRRRHPPLIDSRLIPEILAFRGEGGLRRLWDRYEGALVTVPTEDPGVSLDLDTPSDYERTRRACE